MPAHEESRPKIARDDLHTLLDAIPEDRLPAIKESLDRLADPVLLPLLMSLEDDEPVTDEDLRSIAEARQGIARGDTLSLWTRERLAG